MLSGSPTSLHVAKPNGSKVIQDVGNAAQRALLHLLCLFNGSEVFDEVAPKIRQVLVAHCP